MVKPMASQSKGESRLQNPVLQQLVLEVAKLKQDVKWLKMLIQYVILPLLLLILGILLKP